MSEEITRLLAGLENTYKGLKLDARVTAAVLAREFGEYL